MAFKGRRDLVLFTNKRILFVDKKGWSGKKMAFTSFPYTSVKIFQVCTAGKVKAAIFRLFFQYKAVSTVSGSFDKDCELGFYTEVWFDPPKCNG